MKNTAGVVLTCEHAGNRIPSAYRYLFAGKSPVLSTHRALDIGAFRVAQRISYILQKKLFSCHTSRLLIEVNRSRGHPDLFSEFSRILQDSDKARLLQAIYDPYRKSVKQYMKRLIRRGHTILHLSIHSFTPELHGIKRNVDIGILYDPARTAEKVFALEYQDSLRQATGLRIRRNYPYRGCADGFTTELRRNFEPFLYRGIEIEFNQELISKSLSMADDLAEKVCRALEHMLPAL